VKNSIKKLLSVLCVLALLAGLTGMLPAVADDAVQAEPKNLYQQILERDGFIEGIWFPWFTHSYAGCSLTTNAVAHKWMDNRWYDFDTVGMDAYGADKIYQEIYNLKALGYNMMAYPGSFFGEGVVYDDNGDVLGIKEDYVANMRRLLDMCRQVGIPVMWNILLHSSSMHTDYGFDAWTMVTQMYCNPTVADHYVEQFVRPMCKVLAEYPDVVALVALTDEIENEMNDTAIGNKTAGDNPAVAYGVSKADMLYLVTAMNEVVKEELPGTARTVAANFDDLGTYSDLGLDVLGRNQYGDEGVCHPMDFYYTTAPMILTEFNVADGSGMTERQYLQAHLNYRRNMKENGYQGGFMWCWQPYNSGGSHDLLAKDAQTLTGFRPYIYDLRHHIIDARNEHRGQETMDTPALFYVNMGSAIEWIPSRQAVSMDLLRSTDGGKTWQTVLDRVVQEDYFDGYKCSYTDPAMSADAQYKIVVRDDKGNVVESAVSNAPKDAQAYVRPVQTVSLETILRPTVPPAGEIPAGAANVALSSFGEMNDRPASESVNLIQNGSFENATGGQWNNSSFLRDGMQVVEDATAPEGSHSLFFNSSDNDEYTWYTFTVDVKPNTDYVFSTWIKGDYISEDNRFAASVGVINPKTQKFMMRSVLATRASRDYQQIYPRAWDTHWHLRSVGFNSGSQTQITVGLLGRSSRMWVDGMALYEVNNGVHYLSEQASASLSYRLVDVNSCADQHSQTENIRMEDAASDYWQSGGGWKNGFMSIEENQYGYRNSLKYTGNENSKGVYYIKWIDVKPNTEYVFSMSLRILGSGEGKMCVLADKINGPVSFFTVPFGTEVYGEDWFSLSFGFNSEAVTRIGFSVLDRGGEALFDNIRLFEKSKGFYAEDEYLEEKNGWVQDDYGWVYYENGEMVTSKWVLDSVGWCYLGADGYCVTDKWVADSVGWCYLDGNGRMVTNKWVKDSVGWCYLGGDGYCVTNKWVADSKGWCYLDGNGRMATNKWIKDSVGWCYVGGDGYCVTNKWVADSKGWCYLDGNGRMATNQWIADSKGWCYVGGDGYCKVNAWQKDSQGWCYLDQNGRMVYSQWVEDGGKRYYINSGGYMVTGTVTIGGKKYTFDKNGALQY